MAEDPKDSEDLDGGPSEYVDEDTPVAKAVLELRREVYAAFDGHGAIKRITQRLDIQVSNNRVSRVLGSTDIQIISEVERALKERQSEDG